MDNNSSSPLDSLDLSSIHLDEDLLQWFNELPPLPPISTVPSVENNSTVNNRSNNPLLMVSQHTHDHYQFQIPPPAGPAGNVATTFALGSSSSGKGKQMQTKKMKAVENVRRRRQEMNALCTSLRSLLPAEYIKGKRSTADHLQEAVNYIKDMECGNAILSKKRDALLKIESEETSTSTNVSNYPSQLCVTVTVEQRRAEFFEIVLKSNEPNWERLPLSKALLLLTEQGFDVTNSISTKVDDCVMHTVYVEVPGRSRYGCCSSVVRQAEVDNGRIIDQCLLQQQLTYCYE